MIDLILGYLMLLFRVHFEHAFVNNAEFRLVIGIVPEMDFLLLVLIIFVFILSTCISVQVGLRCLVQALEQSLINQVFASLLVQVGFIIVKERILVLFICLLALIALCQLPVVLVSLLQLTLLLDVDHFRVVDTDGTPQRLRPHDLINEVHGLRRQLDPLNGRPLADVGIDEANRMRVLVVEHTGWNHVKITTSLVNTFKLILGGFGANRNHVSVFETSAGHGSLSLLPLQV